MVERTKNGHISRKATEADKKLLQKVKDKNRIVVRLNLYEQTLLQSEMRKEGIENTSGFVKYRLFGLEPEERVMKLVREGDKDDIATLLKNGVLDLADNFIYIKDRYEKDMRQLYLEEGVDLELWTSTTNKWISKYTKRVEELLGLIKVIAKTIGVDVYTHLPSDDMQIGDCPTQEEIDALSNQLRKERIAMGRTDII